jgi:hypothetical protein
MYLDGDLWWADYTNAPKQIRDAATRLYDSYQLPLGYTCEVEPEDVLRAQQGAPLSMYVEFVLRPQDDND